MGAGKDFRYSTSALKFLINKTWRNSGYKPHFTTQKHHSVFHPRNSYLFQQKQLIFLGTSDNLSSFYPNSNHFSLEQDSSNCSMDTEIVQGPWTVSVSSTSICLLSQNCPVFKCLSCPEFSLPTSSLWHRPTFLKRNTFILTIHSLTVVHWPRVEKLLNIN